MFTFVDAVRLLLATLVGSLVIALPGVALTRAFGLRRREALVVGLAVLPLLDSLSARVLGLDAALAVTLALAVAGTASLVRAPDISLPRAALGLCILWLALVVIEWVDLDLAGRLYQPFSVVDTVKHAATTQAIVDTGVPPRDPFFLRPQRVSYYYFFYMLPALVERLGFGLVDARAAVGGCVFWVGLGLYELLGLAMKRAGFAATACRRGLMVALLAASGLDIIGVVRLGLAQARWVADPLAWNEQVTGWFESTLWVPHHVTALIAALLGLMTLAAFASEPRAPGVSRADRIRGIGLAGACFAATLGLSVWLALALVATAGLWGIALLAERRWRALGALAAAGVLALVLAAPQIHDLVAGRAGAAAAAIAPTVRAFSLVDDVFAPGPMRLLVRALALPINYFAGFGVLASGAILYFRTRERAIPKPEFARVLMLAALAGLTLGAVLRSTLFNNDLGWRVTLFPMVAAFVWTLAALERLPAAPFHRRAPALLLVLLCLGWSTTTYAIVSLRTYPWTASQPSWAFMSADPRTERALRVAYRWADAHLPAGAVLQHDPTRTRAFAFALYGRHAVAVADSFGSLFGADQNAVESRIASLAPIYAGQLPPSEVRARAAAAGIDDLVVTAADPAWARPASFVWRAAPAYASERVRIIPVAALAGLPDASPSGGARSAATVAPSSGG